MTHEEKALQRRIQRAEELAKELGIDLFVRYPRQRLYREMDIRPHHWKEIGWIPAYRPEQRVMSCILYHSWCWPVSMKHAVCIDLDDNFQIDPRTGRPMVMTQERLARYLNMSQAQAWASIQFLVARKDLQVDGHALYPVPKPEPLTVAERKDSCTGVFSQAGQDRIPGPVFRRFSKKLKDLGADQDTCTGVFAQLAEVRTRFLGRLKDIRYEEKEGYQKVSTALGNLIVQSQSSEEAERAISAIPNRRAKSAPAPTRPPSKPSTDEEGRRTAAEYLYAEIPRMQAAFPNAPFSKPRFSALGKADRVLAGHILDALKPTNYDAIGFILMVASQFKGLDQDGIAKLKPRSPNDPNGPRSLGLLIEWAGDYAATFNGRANGAAN